MISHFAALRLRQVAYELRFNVALIGYVAFSLALSIPRSAAAEEAADAASAASTSAAPVDEMVITARNRQEAAQSVPIPTSVVGGLELQRDNSVTALDFANKVPNLSIVQNQPRQSSFSIRGIGKNNSNEFTEGSVGVIIDNVFVVHPGASWGNFYDIQRVEVARGPQGTLLGKNTTMGTVNIVSAAPEFERSSKVQFSYGDLQTLRGSAAFTGPLIADQLAYRVTVGYENGDGPIDNAAHPGETLNDLNRLNGRFQLLARPTDHLTDRFITDFSQSNEYNGAWPFNYGDPATYRDGSDRPTYAELLASRFTGPKSTTIMNSWDTYQANDMGRLESDSRGWSNQLEYGFDSGLTFTSITAGRTYLFKAHNDYDILDDGWSGGYVRTRQFSQELRLTSPKKDLFDYQTGIYYLNIDHKTGSTPGTVGGPDSGALSASQARYDTLNATAVGRDLLVASKDGVFTDTQSNPAVDSLGVYGQVDWFLTDKLTLTTGLRHTTEDRSNTSQSFVWGGTDLTVDNFPGATAAQLAAARAIRGTPRPYAEASLDNSSWSWLVNPSYTLSNNALLYTSVSYGERSGTVSLDTAGQGQFTKPERTTDYELGAKTTLADGRLRLNANLFLTEVRDYQVTLRQEDPLTPGLYVNTFANAEKVSSKGVEFDIAYAVTNNFRLSTSGAFSPSRYDSWVNGRCPADIPEVATTVCDNTGKRVQGSSDSSLTLTANYQSRATFGGSWKWNVFVSDIYRSELDTSPILTPEGHQDAYSVVNAGIGIITSDGAYSFTLDGRNILDKIYLVSYNDYAPGTVGRAAIGQRRFISLTFRANL